jgi:hypothetical protein
LRGKTRNFFEDVVSVVFIGAVIYGGYWLVFENDTKDTEIVKEIETPKVVESSTKIPKVVESNVEKQSEIIVKKTIKTVEKPVVIIEKKEKNEELLVSSNIDKKEQKKLINDFLRTTKNRINSNIKLLENIKTKDENSYVDIRVTILKNGGFEQLKYVDGDLEYFENIQSTIVNIFPIEINEKINDQFPRYFRMRIN